jgi:sugar lactone lactonase YvrE
LQSTVVSGLSSPRGVAVDGSGNVYATSGNDVVKVPWTGSGYGAPATVVSGLSSPFGVAVDASGNLYIADTGNNRVLKEMLSAGSYTQSVVASGVNTPTGVAVDGSGNVFVALNGADSVLKMTLSGGSYTQGVVASGVNGPDGVAVDSSGNVYIADTGNNRVLKETLSAGSYTQSVVPSPSGGLNIPTGVAVDLLGNAYTADTGNNRVLGPWSIFGSLTPPAVSSGLNGPYGVAVDASQNVYIADTGNNRVVKAQMSAVDFGTVNLGNASATVSVPLVITNSGGGNLASRVLTQDAANLDFIDAGTGTCTANHTYSMGDICTVDVVFRPKYAGLRLGAVGFVWTAGNTYAAAYLHGVSNGPQAVFGPGAQSIVASGLSQPFNVAVGGSGNVYILDTSKNLIEVPWTGSGYGASTVVWAGINDFALDGGGGPWSELGSSSSTYVNLTIDGNGYWYANESSTTTVLKGQLYVPGSVTIVSGLNNAQGMALDASGDFYVADAGNNRVLKAPWTGSAYGPPSTVGSGLSGPYGVAVDGSGNVYIADTGNQRVLKAPWTGSAYLTQITLADTTTNGSNFAPVALAVDKSGNVYIADKGNNLVLKLDLADAPSLSFASTAVDSTSSDSPQTATVANIGNAPLTFPIPATGNNPSVAAGFSLSGATTCPQLSASSFTAGTLAQGESCTYAVNFAPIMAGAQSGSLVLRDDSLNAAAPNYATQSIGLSGTGLVAPTTTTVGASAATVLLQNPVTFTAAVPFIRATPTGTVTFKDGSAPLGSATLNSDGMASLTLSTLSVGSHSITAVYGGDANFTGSASPAITETVQDFQLVISGGGASVTLQPGGMANFQFQVSPVAPATNFAAAISLSLTGLPPGATYTITPSTIAAGSGAQTVTVQVQTAQLANLRQPLGGGMVFALTLMPMLVIVQLRPLRQIRAKRVALLLLLLLLLGIWGMSACGGGSGFFNQSPRSYSMQLNATSGNLVRSATLSLTVQ